MSDEFEALLERIRRKEHPQYGTLSWNGEKRQLTVTVQFDGNGVEDDAMIRQRALRYLASLTPEERAIVDLEITFRDGKPVKAILSAGTGELPVRRLEEMKKQAGLE